MSYINAIKNYEIHQEATTTSQVISDTYVELSGSRVNYTPKNYNSIVILSVSQLFDRSPDWNSKIQMKLQESTDNFSSVVNDVSGSHTRIQSIGSNSNGYNNGTDFWFFENQVTLNGWTGKKYFRVMISSGDTNSECTVQQTPVWESSNNVASPPPSVLIKEI